jgi:DNA-binding MarR family transcriptional regulator
MTTQDNPAQTDAVGLADELHGLIGKLKRKLRDQTDRGELTPSQIAVLIRLERDGPATVTELAHAEHVRSQSMGAIVASLQDNKLIRGEPDPQDGRRTILNVTPACVKKIREIRAVRKSWLTHTIENRLTAQERQTLAKAVALLQRIADA